VESSFDPKKNAANLRKHGVPLSEGDGVLNDPLAHHFSAKAGAERGSSLS